MRTTQYLIWINGKGKLIREDTEKYFKRKGYTCKTFKNGRKVYYCGKVRIRVLPLDRMQVKVLNLLFGKPILRYARDDKRIKGENRHDAKRERK
jgi:hypothetical protein